MSSNSPCAACKFLRRKCTQGCVFAPYFPPDIPGKFASVHRVFGASNVAKLLTDIPPARREEAVNSLAYEANARLHDPIHGCLSHMAFLHQKIEQLKFEIYNARKELANYVSPFNQQQSSLPPPYYGSGLQGMGLALMAPGSTSQPQFLMNEQMQIQQQQQQMVEMQQMAALSLREQELMESYGQQQQQQHEFMSRTSGFVGPSVGVPIGQSPNAELSLVSAQQPFENLFLVQQQQYQPARSDEARSGIGPPSSP